MEGHYSKIYLLMVISSAFWAGAFIAGKVAVIEFPPFTLTFLRFFFAFILIFITMVKFEKKDWKLKKQDYLVMIFLGLIGMVGYHILFFIALKYTTAVNSSMIAATNPLVTTVFSSIFLGEKLTVKRIFAIFVAFFGVLLTITRGQISTLVQLDFNPGDLLMVLAVICWAAYSIVSRWVMPKYSPLIITTYSFALCVLFTIPFVILEKPLEFLPQTTIKGWLGVLYMAIFPSYIGYLVQQVSIKEIGPSRTNIFINLVPVFSMILSGVLLKETISMVTVMSCGFIILGVSFTARLKVKEEKRVFIS